MGGFQVKFQHLEELCTIHFMDCTETMCLSIGLLSWFGSCTRVIVVVMFFSNHAKERKRP